jgi:uncharacterized DUF497 family protein
MAFIFEWDRKKAKQNYEKHNVSFEEAATVFEDTLSLTINDPLHSDYEQRFVIIGESIRGRLLVVAHTEVGNKIRIISARVVTKHERKTYEEK